MPPDCETSVIWNSKGELLLGKRVVKLLSQSYLPVQGRFPRIHGEAKTLKALGHDVLIIGWDRTGTCPKKECLDGIDVERITVRSSEMRGPVQAFFLLRFFMKAFLRLLSERIDVIHCHNLDVLPLGYVLSRVKRCKVIFDAHEPNYYALWPAKWRRYLGLVNAVETFLARRMDCIIVTNDYQLRKFKSMGADNTVVIGNYPVESLIIDKVPEEKFQKDEVVFGRVGTIYPDVGIEEAAEAFRGIMEKYRNARLLLAGRVVDSYRETFLRSVGPLDGRVEIVGAYNAPEMPDLYRRVDVSLMIYRRTDWFRHITPTKFFDSLANGVPVIMTDIGGLGDVIRKHNCGIVVDENDIEGIRKAMERMIEDSGLRREMALNGLRLIKEEFNWKRMEKRLAELYDSL